MTPIFEISKTATFDAAHRLPHGSMESGHVRLHGHSFQVEATLRGAADAHAGWVTDLGALEKALSEASKELDHSLLNDHPDLENPTLEALCLWFANRLKTALPALVRIAVSRPTVHERCTMEL